MTGSGDASAEERRSLAVVGPFSSGKSSLINLLARREISEPGIGAEGPSATRHELDDGPYRTVVEARTDEDGAPPSDIAQDIAEADVMIWCTIGSQAWRANEVSAVERLAVQRSGASILAVTRADHFRSAGDQAKVEKRLKKAASKSFSDIVFLNASPKAISQTSSDRKWRAAGGEALAQAIEDAIAAFSTQDDQDDAAFSEDLPETVDQTVATGAEPSHEDLERADLGEEASPPVAEIDVKPKTRPGDTASQPETSGVKEDMSTDISGLSSIAGFLGACMVDSETGLMLGSEGGGAIDLETAGAANTEVVKAKLRAIEALGMSESIEDILITLDSQFHLIRPLASNPMVFIYVALDKKAANLGLARIQVKNVEKTVSL